MHRSAPPAGPIRLRGPGFELEVEGAFVQLPEADVPCEGAWLEAEAQALVTLHAAEAEAGADAVRALTEDWLGLSELPGLVLLEATASQTPGVALRRGTLQAGEDAKLPPLALVLVAVIHKALFFSFLVRAEREGPLLERLVTRLEAALGRLASGEAPSRIVAPRGGLVDPAGRPAASGLVDPSGRPVPSGLVDPSGRTISSGLLDPAGRPAAPPPPPPFEGPLTEVTERDAIWACPALSVSLPIPPALQLLEAQLDGATLASTTAPGILLLHAGLYPDPRAAIALLPSRLEALGMQVRLVSGPELTPAGLYAAQLSGSSPEGDLGVAAYAKVCRSGAAVIALALTSAARLPEVSHLAEALAAGARFGPLQTHPEAAKLFTGTWTRHRSGGSGTQTGAAGGVSTSVTATLRFDPDGRYSFHAESSHAALSAAGLSGAQTQGMGASTAEDHGRWLVSHGVLVRSSDKEGSRLSLVQCDGRRLRVDGVEYAR